MTTTICPPAMPDQLALLVGVESTFGALPTTAIATRVTEFRPGGLQAMEPVAEIGVPGTISQRDPQRLVAGLREPQVALSALLDIENFDWMLQPFFGAPLIAAGSGLDSGFSQRVYGLFSSTGCVTSLSVRGVLAGEARTVTGLVGDTLEIPLGKASGIRQITATYQALDHQRGGSWVPTVTQPRPAYLVPGWSTLIRINGELFTLVDGSLSISAGVERSPDINGRDVSTPRPGRVTVSLSGSVELTSPEQMAIVTRAVSGAPDAVQIEMWPLASNRRRILIDLPFMRLQAPELPVGADATRVPVPITGMAERDPAGATSPVAISLWRSAT